IAASAGNHAQGVAWGSKQLGVSAQLVMPKSAPLLKIQNTRALGAAVILEGNSYDEAYEHARRLSEKSGRVVIHAFEDQYVMAGQGVIGLEILEQLPDADVIIGSVGGGGMMSGISTAVRELKSDIRLYGGQASGAASM